jgi:hypothetical protein
MSRRASLPGAAELFRTTSPSSSGAVSSDTDSFGFPESPVRAVPDPVDEPAPVRVAEPARQTVPDEVEERPRPVTRTATRRRRSVDRRPSGREKHDEKITVYVSADELLDIETARLTLRGDHGLAVDRGRIVREAIAIVLADLESKSDDAILVRRLRGL